MSEQSESRESQRRQATVIFADISGFTAMSEKLDPEEVTEVVNDCFAMVERIVHDLGGTIDKYIGDAVMALFGADRALENAPRRAVTAAIEIRAGLARLNQERRLPAPLAVHIGVNSGLVIAGEVGGEKKRHFTVMGDTVNLAARLEDASEKGQIFVGPATYAETKGDFEYRPTKPLSLKGKAEPVQAYEVVAVKEKPDLPTLGAATRQISSELVGREQEVAALRERIASFLSGAGGITSIVGEAGIGKSRLLAEISGIAELTVATVLTGRAVSVGSGLSYHPFIELLRTWAGIKSADDEREARAKLEAALALLTPDAGPEILPFIATLMGVRLTGAHAERVRGIEADAMERLILKAMNDLLGLLSAQRPLLLFFEDLHWADLSSIKLLESLLRLCVEHPLLFVFAARPGFGDTAERILTAARERFADRNLEIVLEPLDDRQSQVLIRNLLRVDNLPHATRQLIARKAEGNPFYIEEIVRALIDQGAVEMHGDRLAVTAKIDSVTIPGTVQEVILVRVERLDPQAQRLLQIGSVIGRNFFHRLLVELAGSPDADLEPMLAMLKERQVIVERRVRRTASIRRQTFAAEREYVFKHALIQETIYQSLLNRTRRELHLRAAEAIERVFADQIDDFYGMLALHYGRAEKLDKAEEYLLKAGDVAVRSAASAEALGYFREAYRIFKMIHGEGGDPKRKVLLEKNIASALLLTGHLAEARPHFDRALEFLGEKVARTTKEAYRQLAFDAIRVIFRMLVLRGRMSRRPSTPELREAINLLYSRCRVESIADPEWFLFDSMYMVGRLSTVDPTTIDQAFAQWAGVALLFSYSGISFNFSRRAAKIAESLLREDRPADLFTYHLMNFMRDYFEGLWERPSGVDDALIERVMRTGQLWDVDTFLGMDAYKHLDQGNWEAARVRLTKISEIAHDYGYSFAETNEMAIPIFTAVARRDLDTALDGVERYLERPEEMLNLIGLGNKAKILILKASQEKPGRTLEAAGKTLEEADALLRRMGRATPFHSGWYRTAKLMYDVAELDRAAGSNDRALAATTRIRGAATVKAALRTAAALAMIRTEVYRFAGSYFWLLGKAKRATRWWEESLREGQRLGARPELARTHVEIARRLLRSAEKTREVAGKPAAAHLEVARRLFVDLDLDRDLARLSEVDDSRAERQRTIA